MADEHRRVEPRSVVGTGMLTDPERVEQLEHERDRIERQRRERPKRGFHDVLAEAPPFAEDDDEEAAGAEEQAPAQAPAPVEGLEEKPALPKVPPDPRMKRLQAMVPPKGKP